MELFGFTLSRKPAAKPVGAAVVSPGRDDGSMHIGGTSLGGSDGAAYYSQVLDLEATIKNENDLIRRYRETSMYPDCDTAITSIVNEAITYENNEVPVKLDLDKLDFSSAIKKKIENEFNYVTRLLKFRHRAHDIFRQWYVDGRLYYNIVLDVDKPAEGIQQLILIDPRKIRKIKNVKKKKLQSGIEVVASVEEYFLYNDKGLTEKTTEGVKLSLDSVIYVPSEYNDPTSGMMLSYLHKAVKVTNQLKMVEDSLVIYRLSRAPERRIFYIDVGNLPKAKAEQYVNDIMNKYRNKIVYDATTGEVRDDRKHMSMLEDFWMPRREGGKGTEITTLQGGQNLQNLEDVEHFQQKLYQSLNVPIGRMQATSGFNIGKDSEISRDEITFSKFINQLHMAFSKLFLSALRVQLIAKGIINQSDWDDIEEEIVVKYTLDNHFAELKEAEILTGRLELLGLVDQFVGRYYDVRWVKKNILKQTELEIEDISKRIEEDKDNEDPALQPSPMMMAQMGMEAQQEQDTNLQTQQIDQENAEHQSGLRKDEIKVTAQHRPKPAAKKK